MKSGTRIALASLLFIALIPSLFSLACDCDCNESRSALGGVDDDDVNDDMNDDDANAAVICSRTDRAFWLSGRTMATSFQ